MPSTNLMLVSPQLACFMAMLFCLASWPAMAQRQIAAGDACAVGVEGENTAHYDNFLVCTSTVWVRQPVAVGASAATCNSTYAGYLRWTGTAIEICNGTSWGGLLTAAGSDGELIRNSSGSFAGATNSTYTSSGTLLRLTNNVSNTQILDIRGAAAQSAHLIEVRNSSDTVISAYTVAGGMLMDAGSATEPSYSFASDTNTGVFSPGADTIGFTAGGTEYMRLDSSGNLGVGTTSPQSRLQVPDAKYFAFAQNSAGAPTATDCDADNERGRLAFDTTNDRFYICNGATRGWDYVNMTD